MKKDIMMLIGEATTYDKKQFLERNKPKSWLKSVSAFANGIGGTLIFGIDNDGEVVGLDDAEGDAEIISEAIKSKIDPIPAIDLRFETVEGKKLIVLQVRSGQEMPYYYIGDKQRLAYVRLGNESEVADRLQLKQLVLKVAGRTYDSMPSLYKFEDMAFTKLRSAHYRRLGSSFDPNDFASWGIIDEEGHLTNAGALLADESPMRQSRIFCTRWNGITMTSGLGEAIDDVELEGSVIGQLQDAMIFVRNNSKKKWWKEADHREEMPDYPERAVLETITNAIIHRNYMEMGSEIHIDMFDDRLEVYSPGGMYSGKQIQDLDLQHIPSSRRNPLLADFFSRLRLMERRGSGMRKIIDAYTQYAKTIHCRLPKFHSESDEFHATLWNLNYDVVKEGSGVVKETTEFVKDDKEFVKGFVKEKEFVKASRKIYKLISLHPTISASQMAEHLGVSSRQVQKYLRRLQELQKVVRVGGRKMGKWEIVDNEYSQFFTQL